MSKWLIIFTLCFLMIGCDDPPQSSYTNTNTQAITRPSVLVEPKEDKVMKYKPLVYFLTGCFTIIGIWMISRKIKKDLK